MREFNSIGDFLKFFATRAEAMAEAEREALQWSVETIRDEAKHEIGNYQGAAGPFEAWAPLSDATLEGFHHPLAGYIPGKVELGYAPPDNPLLREGHLREDINCLVEGRTGAVGSNDDVAVWQELGTPNAMYPIPPRSFLGGAAVRKEHTVVTAIGSNVAWAFAGLASMRRR